MEVQTNLTVLTKDTTKNYIKEINNLHKKIFGNVRTTLEKAIKIGQLLIECKQEIPHGEWLHWMNINLKFSQEQARRYMRAYGRRDNLKSVSETDLGGWEKLLIEHKPKQEVIEEDDIDEKEENKDEKLIEVEVIESKEEKKEEEQKEDEKPIEPDEISEMLDRGEETKMMGKVIYYWNSCTLQEKIVLFKRFKKDMKGV